MALTVDFPAPGGPAMTSKTDMSYRLWACGQRPLEIVRSRAAKVNDPGGDAEDLAYDLVFMALGDAVRRRMLISI
jgi:hypothetical protein